MLERFNTPSAEVVFLTASRPKRTFQGLRGIPGAPAFATQLYSAMRRGRRMTAAVVVFCDVERIGPEIEDKAAALAQTWDRLAPAPLLLNRPPNAMRRYPLMKALKVAGINQHDVARLDDPEGLARIRFPCFVRYENGHLARGQPELIQDEKGLVAAIGAMKLRGETLYGKIAVEYADVRDAHGDHVKYSYFRIGRTLIPSHRFAGPHWFVKSASPEFLEQRPDAIAAERQFLEEAPFQDEIARVFDIAGVDYGRVDFGLRSDGGVHVFEINTNPRHPLLREAYHGRQDLVRTVKTRLGEALSDLVGHRRRIHLHWRRGAM
jgi:hypothetical protein